MQSTISGTAATAAAEGSQQARVCWYPPYVSSSGVEAIELAASAGLYLDEWQGMELTHALGERADGSWSAFEVGVCIPRQNGKDGLLEARELAGLYLLDEKLLTHSAHQFDTSLEHFRRLLALIEWTPDLSKRVKRISRSHGEEGIELHGLPGQRVLGGQRIRFRTRTGGGGRGFSGDLLVLNEAMIITEAAHGALLPTLSAQENPQVWYTGSAVDQTKHDHGLVFARVRARGVKGGDPRLAYFEHSPDLTLAQAMMPEHAKNSAHWAAGNPALGNRISHEYVEQEQRALDPRTFAVERLGVGDWPDPDGAAARVISKDAWAARTDTASALANSLAFCIDTTPDRSSSVICVAGRREDGDTHGELIDQRPGTDWLVDRAVEIVRRHGRKTPVLIDANSPAASLVAELKAKRVEVREVTTKEHGQACGIVFDAVAGKSPTFWHLGQEELEEALKGAAKAPLGDELWKWSRKNSGVDISPLVGVTLALWGCVAMPKAAPKYIDLNDTYRQLVESGAIPRR